MATPQYMPAAGERGAPKFDKTKPRELTRFFSEFERCLVRVGITVEQEKKDELLRYVDFDTEQIWKRFPEYVSQVKTYVDFRKAILVHYLDPAGDYVYSIRDLDTLINDCLRNGINNADDLQAYHLAFVGLMTWLIEKDHMGDYEQRSRYIHAFRQPLLGSIQTRLQMQFLNHHPNKPHTINEVHGAARYLLQSSNSSTSASYPSMSPVKTESPVATITPGHINVKTETFASVMADFTKTIVKTLNQGNRSRIMAATPHNHSLVATTLCHTV
jgi:hypothetical protein